MSRHLLIATVTFAFCFYLSSCKNDKNAIINSMIKYGTYEGMYYGKTNKISPQWKNYEALTNKFSENELIELCDHTNPIVRCYAFKALAYSHSAKTYNVLLKHLSDTCEFERSYGDIDDDDRVTDNFLDEVSYEKRLPTKYNLTEQQYKTIDSILLFGEEIKQRSVFASIKFRSRRYMLERTMPLPTFHQRIREIVEDGVYEALPLLAQYKNLSDTGIFKKLLVDSEFSNKGRNLKIYVRESIKYFPHPSFYPILKQQLIEEIGTNNISDWHESYPLYIALVQYPTADTRALFKTSLKKSGDEFSTRSKYIYYALQKYPSKIFEGVVTNENKVTSK